ncbi:hypothetical protein [Microbulbifer sp. 2205BS26-8]|nr:hypothetical protein [Microbulbifer sp. 2205BS26-8]MDP5210430.1 hypothetical protein [Microbulbifer sp. 2205BS26-8]
MYRRLLLMAFLGLLLVGCNQDAPNACSDKNEQRSLPFPHAMI